MTRSSTHPGPAARAGAPLLDVRDLAVEFPIRDGVLRGGVPVLARAVDGVSFVVNEGETLGIVGESGCGKTTLARCLVGLVRPTEGSVHFRGNDLTKANRAELRAIRREVQMVFQDPYASLNPRKRIGQIIAAPLRLLRTSRFEAERRVRQLITLVGLDISHLERYPHEFSGGQRQRIGIARALAVSPRLIVLDEPVSALDVSVQAQIINLLDDLQEELGVSYVFVGHDLSVVRHVSHRIAVMHHGTFVELGGAEDVCTRPQHEYTTRLIRSIPRLDPEHRAGRLSKGRSGPTGRP
jgi:ABC-type oligopeptide transport system ATPase subunit